MCKVYQQMIIPESLRDRLEQLWETENGCQDTFEEFVGMKLAELMGYERLIPRGRLP